MKDYNLSSRWENRLGVHEATLTLRPDISTRPLSVGVSIGEVVTSGEGQRSHLACAVLEPEQLMALYTQIGEAIGRKTGLVPIILLEQACDLVDRATSLAVPPGSQRHDPDADCAWGEIGYELERVRKQIT